MKKSELCLFPYDPAWKQDFENERTRILDAANRDILSIEHVGSTSIPNVHAKPILDLALICNKSELTFLSETLNNLGYDYRGLYGDDCGHYYAVLDRSGVRYCQAHIYTDRSSDWSCKLKFRDVLRVNDILAGEYSSYKLEVAKKARTKGEYAEIKSSWLDSFILKVMEA